MNKQEVKEWLARFAQFNTGLIIGICYGSIIGTLVTYMVLKI